MGKWNTNFLNIFALQTTLFIFDKDLKIKTVFDKIHKRVRLIKQRRKNNMFLSIICEMFLF